MKSVVIVAGGSGSRMQSEIPKQFLEIKGKPVIVWTIEKFMAFDSSINIILVLPEEHLSIWEQIYSAYNLSKNIQVTTGGSSRHHSVKNGLQLVNAEDIVAIHDAVRPLVSVETIKRCFVEAKIHDSAIPVIDSEDSLRKETDIGSMVIERSLIKRVQTPQVFKADKIMTAYSLSSEGGFTDDASVFEACFGTVNLVKGNRENIKITYPMDLVIAEFLLKSD